MVVLRYTSDLRVEVDGYLSSRQHGVRGPITFVVDTGSHRTILGPRDAAALGFPTGEFPRYSGLPLFGIGGKGVPLDAGPCQIVLGDAEIVDDEPVLFFAPEREEKIRSKGGGARQERRVRTFALPSLLGCAFLERNRCVLTVDFARRQGEIRQVA